MASASSSESALKKVWTVRRLVSTRARRDADELKAILDAHVAERLSQPWVQVDVLQLTSTAPTRRPAGVLLSSRINPTI